MYKHTLLVSFGSISGLTLKSGCTMNRHFRILDATINLRWSSAIFTFRKWAPHKKSRTTNSQPTTRGRAKAAWLVIGSYRDLQSPEEWDVMAAQSDGSVWRWGGAGLSTPVVWSGFCFEPKIYIYTQRVPNKPPKENIYTHEANPGPLNHRAPA